MTFSQRYFYLFAFIFSTIVFWWLPSIILFILDLPMMVSNETLGISILALLLYSLGYIIVGNKKISFIKTSKDATQRVAKLSKKIIFFLMLPSLIFSILFYLSRIGTTYGEGAGIPILYQSFFYLEMTFFFMYISTTNDKELNPKIFWFIVFVSILIRFIVSATWGRFFVGQIIVAFLIVAIIRRWLVFDRKGIFKVIAITLFIFFVPAIMRGDFKSSSKQYSENLFIEFVTAGSTLKLFEDNKNLDLSSNCNPLFVSLFAKTIPFSFVGSCTIDIWGEYNLPATLDRILAENELGKNSMKSLRGPGSNYLLELYISLNGNIGIIIGSFIFGIISRFSVNSLHYPTIFGLIWIEILSRALFAPRSNIGYVFERIPSLLLLSFLMLILANSIYKRGS